MTSSQREPTQNRRRGRAGGRAGGAGYDFQDLYVANQLAKLLVGYGRDPLTEVLWEKKSLDAGSRDGVEPVYVDDAILRYTSGKCAYVQVRETSPKGGWSAQQLVKSSVAQQFWQQWSSKQPADRPRTTMHLACRGDITTLEQIADAAACARTPQEMLHGDDVSAEVVDQILALAALLELERDSEEFLAFLQCVKAVPIASATDLEDTIVQSLPGFGEDARDLKNTLIRLVARSKHAGPEARSFFTKDSLVKALLDEGVSRQRLIAADVLPAGPVDEAVWNRYRELVLRKFRSFKVYGLQVDHEVYADLPALFVPLKLAEIPAGRRREIPERKRGARGSPSLAERLSAEADREHKEDSRDEDERSSDIGRQFDLAAVLGQKRRFAIIGGPGIGKTTTLKWLAIVAALPGEEGQRLRSAFGLPHKPLVPIYVRFRQFADRIGASKLAGLEGRVGLVASFLKAHFEAELADQFNMADRTLSMAQHLLASNTCLFLFDGLDEVADESIRNRLFEAVSDLIEKYDAPRVIVTSRPYAFRRDRVPLDLALFEPVPLDRAERRAFAQQWYRAVRISGVAPLEEPELLLRAEDLAKATDALPDLAEVPLLLSIMALVHFNQGGLPVERATLYDHATLAMLGHWEKDPAGRNIEGDIFPNDWAHLPQFHEKEIRQVVEHLAKRTQIHGEGGEFSRAEAIANLAEGLQALPSDNGRDASSRAELLLDLLVDRAGLVQERSPDVFAFVHLSFQEYLTARSFVGRGEVGLEELVNLATDERHGEVCRMAVAILSADQQDDSDNKVAAFITSIGARSPALAAACILEAPRVHLEEAFAEHLARAAFSECTDPRRNYYRPHITARLVWNSLAHTSAADRVLLEILSDSANELQEERYFGKRRGRHFRDRHFRELWQTEMRTTPITAVVAGRPSGPLSAELAWVLQRLVSHNDNHGQRNFCNLAKLLLIETGDVRDRDHVPALIGLLAENEREREKSRISRTVVARAERILENLLKVQDTRAIVLNILSQNLSPNPESPAAYASESAWVAAKFLIEHDELTELDLAKTVITIGLERPSRHTEAIPLLKTLVRDPNLGAKTVSMLRNGLLDADSDVRGGCFRVLVELDLISDVEGIVDDEQGLSMKLLADPTTAKEALVTLAENLWSESHSVAWQAVKSLVDAGHVDVPGLPHALVHSGLVSARAEAMQYLHRLHDDAALSVSIRGALLGGLASSNASVSTSAAIVLAEMDAPDDTPLLGRIIQALLQNPDQVGEVIPHLQRFIGDQHTSEKAIEVLGNELQRKPDHRVGSALARMLAQQGLFHAPNLPDALVRFGLHHRSDYKEVAGYLRRMLDDPELAATTRRALVEGLSFDKGDVDVGAAFILWEAGSRTNPKIAGVLANAGLRIEELREQAHAWLLELFARPKTAIFARNGLESALLATVNVSPTHSRKPDHAWAIANCLLSVGAVYTEELAEALIIGGFYKRDSHPKALAKIKQVIAENAEFAVVVEEALWEALSDNDEDIQWGAASALIDNGFVETMRASEESADDEERDYRQDHAEDDWVKKLSSLWRVLIREAASEPLASTALSSLSGATSTSAPEYRALIRLLDREDSPETACAAAFRLLAGSGDDVPAAAFTLIRYGLTDRDRRFEASLRLDQLLKDELTRPVIFDALRRALWDEKRDVSWAAVQFLLDRDYSPAPEIFRALVSGGLLSLRRRRSAEEHLRKFLKRPNLRGAVVDALSVGLYGDEEEDTSLPARLLVEAGAPLNERILMVLDDLSFWQPWAPLALMALTGRQQEAQEAAMRHGFGQLADTLGNAP